MRREPRPRRFRLAVVTIDVVPKEKLKYGLVSSNRRASTLGCNSPVSNWSVHKAEHRNRGSRHVQAEDTVWMHRRGVWRRVVPMGSGLSSERNRERSEAHRRQSRGWVDNVRGACEGGWAVSAGRIPNGDKSSVPARQSARG